MRKFSIAIIIVLFIGTALVGCSKSEDIPLYVGGTGQDSDLAQDEEVQPMSYAKITISCPVPENQRGFIDSDTELDNYWQQNCQGVAVPSFDFDDKFIAYYSTIATGCEEVRVAGVTATEDQTVIIIEKGSYPEECPCTRNLKPFFIYLSVPIIEETTPTFKEVETEIPCPMAGD